MGSESRDPQMCADVGQWPAGLDFVYLGRICAMRDDRVRQVKVFPDRAALTRCQIMVVLAC